MPCYNEAKRLQGDLFISYIKEHRNIFFLFVNDGSIDSTDLILNDILQQDKNNILVLSLPKNVGKAEAVRHGILESLRWHRFDYIGYLDADLSSPLTEIQLLINKIENDDSCKMIIGSRVKRLGATIKRNEVRHYLGRIVSTLTSVILKLPAYDTQCGLKIFSNEYAQHISSTKFETTWLFDCEILARLLQRYGYKEITRTIYEIPLNTWIERGGSKIKIEYLFKIPRELYSIYKNILQVKQ